MEIGRNGDSDDAALVTQGDDNNEHDEINEAARDMLLRLPGVNAHNARKIMQECDSIAELMEMSREELRKIAGPVTGQKLFTFFRQKMQAT
jgi:DNA excision repair protein ERCC-4